jgi:hypothetical protein
MDEALRDLVRRRAQEQCEYCLLEQQYSELRHHVEHIVARKHGGSDDASNLALACQRCNLHKGSNLTGVDDASGEVVRLYHPRKDEWDVHFRITVARIDGLTAVGRATVRVLGMNTARRVELRAEIQKLR